MGSWVNWILVVAGALLILIEVVLGAITGFDFLLIGSAILIGGAFGFMMHSAVLGLVAAGVLSIAYVTFGRQRIRGTLRRPGLPSNIDALLGRTALVIEPIRGDRPGRIKFEGEEWRALPDPDLTGYSEGTGASDAPAGGSQALIPAGRNVHITRIDGVTVYVVPVENPAGGNRS